MTLDDIQTDLVAKVQEQLSIKKWLAQEVPWYQSYMKSGLTMYLLYYMLQVRRRPISQLHPRSNCGSAATRGCHADSNRTHARDG